MNEQEQNREHGQSIIIVAMALVALIIFAALAVDIANTYVHRRTMQNAADAAALAGARELADQYNACALNGCDDDLAVRAAMDDFAERNGVVDPGQNVEGFYLDEHGDRVNEFEIGLDLPINADARGVEAFARSVAPTFFGGVLGLDGLQVEATSGVIFNGNVCTLGCIAPIATFSMPFEFDQCYNIWDGSRQQSSIGGGYCSIAPGVSCSKDNECNFGNCKNGTCRDNSSISCSSNGECSGICEGSQDVCSNDTDTTCNNDNGCDFGSCVNNACSGSSSIICATDADCQGTCGPAPAGWFCSDGTENSSALPCTDDADCPTGEWCEDEPGVSNSALGWLNWSLQGSGHSCKDVGLPSDCSTTCLVHNLDNADCLSGQVSVDDWVAGASGVKNSSNIRAKLQWYIDTGAPMTTVVYDVFDGTGCNQGQGGGKARYHVVGFAKWRVLGYELSQGSGSAYGHDGAGCVDWGAEGNRITGEFIGWVEDGGTGDCDSAGSIVAPVVFK